MEESRIPHFSKNILIISLLFLMVNLAWFGVTALSRQTETFKPVAPVLEFASAVDTIEIRSPYDTEFRDAAEGQELISGTRIRTGENEFAELVLESNIVRLDENTEVLLLENNFTDTTAFETKPPRLVLALLSGSVWVNAFDTIEIRASQSQVKLGHSIGSFGFRASNFGFMSIASG